MNLILNRRDAFYPIFVLVLASCGIALSTVRASAVYGE